MTAQHRQLQMIRPDLNELPPTPKLPEGYALRPANGFADDVQLARVLTVAFRPEMQWSENRVREELTGNENVPLVLVVSRDMEIVSTTSIQVGSASTPIAKVHWVGTDPAHSGQGLGHAVVVHTLHEMARLSFSSARLSTDDQRLPAIRTYLKCGFVPVLAVDDEDHHLRWSRVLQQLFTTYRS